MKRTPNHTTVVAYLALFVALGTGGAYAVERITSKDVENNSLRSVDLKQREGVTGKDVKRNSLTGEEVREESLNASKFAPVSGVGDAGDCDPSSITPIDCVTAGIELANVGAPPGHRHRRPVHRWHHERLRRRLRHPYRRRTSARLRDAR